MKIHGFVVSVNYAGELARTLPRWSRGLSRITTITDQSDDKSAEIGMRYGAVHRTDAFTRRGASFNKGRALHEAMNEVAASPAGEELEWVLLFDADILPPADWVDRLAKLAPRPGSIYGARRFQTGTTKMIPDREPCGYFMLFHAGDPAVPAGRPGDAIDANWVHAGNYDTTFVGRWPRCRRVWLPGPDFVVTHLGEPGVNWWGRGPGAAEKMREMYRKRAERGGGYAHEVVE